MIKDVEIVLDVIFKPGYNLNVKCMRNTLDPIATEHRPLIIYISVIILGYLTYL